MHFLARCPVFGECLSFYLCRLQQPLERLRWVKVTTDRVLFLSQYNGTALSDRVTFLEVWSLWFEVAIFVEFPWSRAALPRKTDVVPLAVEGGNRCSPVNTVEVLLTGTLVSGHFYVRQPLQNPGRSPELCSYSLCGFKRIFLRF